MGVRVTLYVCHAAAAEVKRVPASSSPQPAPPACMHHHLPSERAASVSSRPKPYLHRTLHVAGNRSARAAPFSTNEVHWHSEVARQQPLQAGGRIVVQVRLAGGSWGGGAAGSVTLSKAATLTRANLLPPRRPQGKTHPHKSST